MSRLPLLVAIVPLCLLQPSNTQAQSRDTSVKKEAPAAAPTVPHCCSIVRVDLERSLVTARETATGFTFRFEVKARRLLGVLKIGQPVWADFTTKTVKLKATDSEPCCAIVPEDTR